MIKIIKSKYYTLVWAVCWLKIFIFSVVKKALIIMSKYWSLCTVLFLSVREVSGSLILYFPLGLTDKTQSFDFFLISRCCMSRWKEKQNNFIAARFFFLSVLKGDIIIDLFLWNIFHIICCPSWLYNFYYGMMITFIMHMHIL